MRTALIVTASLIAISGASAEDAWMRLRNASANELCWDTARGLAREKYPGAGPEEPELLQVSLARTSVRNPVKDGRKSFPGIRTC